MLKIIPMPLKEANAFVADPGYSPWGEIQNCKALCPGAYQVDTDSHGGVMVSTQIMDKVLSKAAQKYGFQEGGFLCFEEDCAAPVALRELMDKGLYTAPVNEYFKPGEFSQVIDRSLRQWHPEYWAAYVRNQQKPSIKARLSAKPVPAYPTASKSKDRGER